MIIRYPGSKARLISKIKGSFPESLIGPLWANSNHVRYYEPFFGAGAIGIDLLEWMPESCPVRISDYDYGIACLWKSVLEMHAELCGMVAGFTPSVEAFELYKGEDGREDIDPLIVGFRKLALHQMSYSGLGVKSGGPLGGVAQSSDGYKIDCRWSAARLQKSITDAHGILSKFSDLRIERADFMRMLTDDPKAFYYLDPPYYEKGPILYKHFLSDEQHLSLARWAKSTRAQWVLSYDDHPFIRELYGWADISAIEMTSTVSRCSEARRPKNKEIIIKPRGKR
jgi:DNA adenine methylase